MIIEVDKKRSENANRSENTFADNDWISGVEEETENHCKSKQ